MPKTAGHTRPGTFLRLLRKPVFKFGVFRHLQHAEGRDILPDAVEIVAIVVFKDRRYLSRLQVDGDKAALLRGSCQLSVLCQCIGLCSR